MLFKILLKFLFGYFKIEIEGYYVEKFINSCINNNIFLWRTSRTKTTIMNANIGTDDINKAEELAKRYQCHIKILREKGVPFILKKYKKRKLFFILLLALIVIIIALSKFVWNVEVLGNNKVDAEEIIEMAKEDGLNIGVLKSKVDSGKIINRIRMEREDIAWIGIEIKGTNAIIKIVEADEKPDVVNEDEFSNIVAKKSGVITKITATNGTAMHQVGDTVNKGDILISGWMEGKYTGKYYVNSNGEVKAKIIYTQIEQINKSEDKRNQTGKSESKYSIKFNNFQINFYKRLSKFKKYDTMYTTNKVKLFPNFYLPIDIIKTTNYEVNETEISYDENTAKATGEKIAQEKLDKMVEGEVINKNTEITDKGNYFNVKVIYEVIENIGTKEKIEY